MENSCAVFIRGVRIKNQSCPGLTDEDIPKVLLDKLKDLGTITNIESFTMYLVECISLYLYRTIAFGRLRIANLWKVIFNVLYSL